MQKGETRLEEFLLRFGKIGADVVEQAPRVGAPSPALSGQPNCKARNYPQKAPQPTSAIPVSSAGTGCLLRAHLPPPLLPARCSPAARQDQVTGWPSGTVTASSSSTSSMWGGTRKARGQGHQQLDQTRRCVHAPRHEGLRCCSSHRCTQC